MAKSAGAKAGLEWKTAQDSCKMGKPSGANAELLSNTQKFSIAGPLAESLCRTTGIAS